MSAGGGHSAALIAETMAAVAHLPADRVRVTGDGPLARQLQGRGLHADTAQAPLAVVETTGRGAGLTAACAAVADGGLVVLAADGPEPVDIDLYRDAHRRGLVMLGTSGHRAPAPSGDDSLARE
ncbi:MAG TPA: hypothetical protein VGF70_15175 [Solirubrobacteraceae bacterium]|jgi:hypothetical protein